MGRDLEAYKAILGLTFGQVAHRAAPIIAAQRDAAAQAATRKANAEDDVSLTGDNAVSPQTGAPAGDENDPAMAIYNAQMQH